MWFIGYLKLIIALKYKSNTPNKVNSIYLAYFVQTNKLNGKIVQFISIFFIYKILTYSE